MTNKSKRKANKLRLLSSTQNLRWLIYYLPALFLMALIFGYYQPVMWMQLIICGIFIIYISIVGFIFNVVPLEIVVPDKLYHDKSFRKTLLFIILSIGLCIFSLGFYNGIIKGDMVDHKTPAIMVNGEIITDKKEVVKYFLIIGMTDERILEVTNLKKYELDKLKEEIKVENYE